MRAVTFGLLATGFLLGACTGEVGGGAPGVPIPDPSVTRSPQCLAAPLASGPAYVRRLTKWEYANTVADTLKVRLTDAALAQLPGDIRANGFSNDFGGQLATFDNADHYSKTAEAVGTALAATPMWLTTFAPCGDTGAACRDSIVRALGLHLFRRPATADEVTNFGKLFDAAVAAGLPAASDAAIYVVRAMLQAPQFLYRLEAQMPMGGADARALDSFEIATRVSYLITGSAPDQPLLDAAAAGTLTQPEALRAQVTRLLGQPRARDIIQRYFREWLKLDDLDDLTLGPTYTPALAAAMKKETLDVAADQLWDAGKPLVATMLTTRSTMVSGPLGQFYNVGTPDAAGRLSLAAAPNRVGLLTHAGVLTVSGDGNASMVERGLFVYRKLLCQEVGMPPPGATSVMLAPDTASERQKSDARLTHQPCGSCHGTFNPLAYGFEQFDAMGAVQAKDKNGNAVRQDGSLTKVTGPSAPYDDVAAYMNLLAQDSRVPSCVTARVAQFAWGRGMTDADACMLTDVEARANATPGRTFADLVAAVATAPQFRYSAVK